MSKEDSAGEYGELLTSMKEYGTRLTDEAADAIEALEETAGLYWVAVERAEAAESECDALQACAEIITYLIGAPKSSTTDQGHWFAFRDEQHRKDFSRLTGDLVLGPIAGHPNATDRADAAIAQRDALQARVDGVVRELCLRAEGEAKGSARADELYGWARELENKDIDDVS